MSATYDPSIPSDMDWVRSQIGDVNVSAAALEDETIDYILTEEPNKYLAAARCGDMILAKKKGAVEKQIGKLRLKHGSGSAKSHYQEHLQRLREEGARMTMESPYLRIV